MSLVDVNPNELCCYVRSIENLTINDTVVKWLFSGNRPVARLLLEPLITVSMKPATEQVTRAPTPKMVSTLMVELWTDADAQPRG
jgi:hypothetical protein